MQAIVLTQAGSASNMHFQEVPRPTIASGQVLVKVHACGVAHRDVIERRGDHPLMQYPIIQGHEFAGEVVELGSGCSLFQVGDKVINLYTDSCGHRQAYKTGDERLCTDIREAYGLTVNGGYAEYVAVNERGLERLIDGISYQVGATLMSAVGVGYNNVVHTAKIRAGEHVLITGASGGVGLAALQTVNAIGAIPWVITGNEKKRQQLLQHGAGEVLVDDGTQFHKQVRKLRPQGLDAVIDCVGSPTLNASLRSLRKYGRVVVIGNVDTSPLRLNLGLLVTNALQLLGSDNVNRSALREVMQWVCDGKIVSVIDQVLPLSQATTAHTKIENRAIFGRIVLQVSASE